MSCFCIGGPNCCLNRPAFGGFEPDWTYRPVTQPMVTAPGSTVEIIPPKPCNWLGHEFKLVPESGGWTVYCQRCGSTKQLNSSGDL